MTTGITQHGDRVPHVFAGQRLSRTGRSFQEQLT